MAKLSALIVDDEAPVRTGSGAALVDAGFQVVEASDTEAALSVLGRDAEHIDAVVTNVDMAGRVNGIGLARRVNARWPWIKLLMTSGRQRPRAAELPPGIGFLRKPYDGKSMARRLRELILQRK